MSDVMLLGVLRMPIEYVGAPLSPMAQLVSRAREAADRIEADAVEIARLRAELAAERERWRALLRTPHRMAGGCPDEVAGHDSRDLDCPACRLMQELGPN